MKIEDYKLGFLLLAVILCSATKTKSNTVNQVQIDSTNSIQAGGPSMESQSYIMINLDSDLKEADIVGVWHSTIKYLDAKYDTYNMIYKLKGNHYLRMCQFSSVHDNPFKTADDFKLSKTGDKYFRDGSNTGDYHMISKNGKLLSFDNQGIINDYSTKLLSNMPQYKLKK